jgi:hypothetical protein
MVSEQPSMELFQDISNQPPHKQQQPVLKTFERRRRVVGSLRAFALLLVTTQNSAARLNILVHT